jgi:hypothetical protein
MVKVVPNNATLRILRAGARHAADERREIARQLVELAGAHEVLAVIDIGMGDHQVGRHAPRFAGCGDLVVVVDRGAHAQAPDHADARHAVRPLLVQFVG